MRLDHLYVACWGKGHVAVVDTKIMEIIRYIDVPARIPAICCFAGEAMDQLVVVTAAWKTDSQEYPRAGCTFIQKTETRGKNLFVW